MVRGAQNAVPSPRAEGPWLPECGQALGQAQRHLGSLRALPRLSGAGEPPKLSPSSAPSSGGGWGGVSNQPRVNMRVLSGPLPLFAPSTEEL